MELGNQKQTKRAVCSHEWGRRPLNYSSYSSGERKQKGRAHDGKMNWKKKTSGWERKRRKTLWICRKMRQLLTCVCSPIRLQREAVAFVHLHEGRERGGVRIDKFDLRSLNITLSAQFFISTKFCMREMTRRRIYESQNVLFSFSYSNIRLCFNSLI